MPDLTPSTLERWVSENVESRQILESDLIVGGLKKPGAYYIGSEFDWTVIGFNPDVSQIRLVGPSVQLRADDHVIDDIDSIFLTEVSSYGFLVDVNSTGFRLLENQEGTIYSINKRVAVLCSDYDR